MVALRTVAMVLLLGATSVFAQPEEDEEPELEEDVPLLNSEPEDGEYTDMAEEMAEHAGNMASWYDVIEQDSGVKGSNKYVAIAELCGAENEHLEDSMTEEQIAARDAELDKLHAKHVGLLQVIEGPAQWYEMQMSEKYRFTNFWYTKHCGGLKVPHIRIFETTTLIERLPALKSEKGIDTIPKHRVIKTDGMPAEKILGMLAKFSINLPANPPHGEL